MQNVSYYRVLTDVDNNFLSEEVPIQVNCTGYSRYSGEVWGRTVRRDYYLFYPVSYTHLDVYKRQV